MCEIYFEGKSMIEKGVYRHKRPMKASIFDRNKTAESMKDKERELLRDNNIV